MKPSSDDRQFIWLQSSMLRLYDIVEPDAEITGVAISLRTGDGASLLYLADARSHEIQRTYLTAESIALAQDFAAASIDLTPEAAP